MYDKIWESHLVRDVPANPRCIYIDRHLIHEVHLAAGLCGTGGRGAQGAPARPDLRGDGPLRAHEKSRPAHRGRERAAADSRRWRAIASEHGIRLFDMSSRNQGIVHIIGPELGITQPGLTIVCGDSHTSTHGAFGALAFGIGTSEVEHVLATQCLQQDRSKTMHVDVSTASGPAASRPRTWCWR